MHSPSTASPVSPARAWSIAALLFMAGFINYLDRAIVSVALPVIAVDLHLGPAAKEVLLSAFFWSYALMQLPMGWAADRHNLRWLYSLAFALWSLACGFTGFAASLVVLITMRIILGIGESVYLPGGMKIVSLLWLIPWLCVFPASVSSERTADDTAAVLLIGSASFVGLATGNIYSLLASIAPEGAVGTWMGILNFAGNLSGIVAPIVTGMLIERTGWHYTGFVPNALRKI